MNPETKFQIKVLKALRALPHSWWCKISQKSISGTPDILGCYHGVFIGLELKKDSKSHPSPLQIFELDRISKAKGRSYLAHPENWENVLEDIKEIETNGRYSTVL